MFNESRAKGFIWSHVSLPKPFGKHICILLSDRMSIASYISVRTTILENRTNHYITITLVKGERSMILDDSIKAAKSTGTILNSKPTVNVVSLCHRGVHLLTSCMGDIDSKKNCLQGIYYIYILYIISVFLGETRYYLHLFATISHNLLALRTTIQPERQSIRGRFQPDQDCV